jgi:hypothetical protein
MAIAHVLWGAKASLRMQRTTMQSTFECPGTTACAKSGFAPSGSNQNTIRKGERSHAIETMGPGHMGLVLDHD